jgi:hypothetical protein
MSAGVALSSALLGLFRSRVIPNVYGHDVRVVKIFRKTSCPARGRYETTGVLREQPSIGNRRKPNTDRNCDNNHEFSMRLLAQ